MNRPDILRAVEPVIKAFEKLGIDYYIGGSIASSAYGMARASLDVDMVSNLKIQHIHPLVEILGIEYYIDEDMILNAIERQSSFNLIHFETMIKVDIFLPKDDPFSKETFKRKRKESLDLEADAVEFYFASCEDIILHKLAWFRKGGNVSEHQWSDVVGVLKVQSEALDKKYLLHWAGKIGILDSLKKALREARILI
ncbi:MAG: hypothetical protein JW896_11385 [Deltaproteobacteria bacterium]|nr:hypothetical protein [Deltaproteobacteria bacterium]